MSGFGNSSGGFGSGFGNSSGGFGSNNNNNNNNNNFNGVNGGGFGGAPAPSSGFGSAPNNAGFGGGAPSGAPPPVANPFAAPSGGAGAAPTGFGSAGFSGGGGGGFGSVPPPQTPTNNGVASGGFGSAPAPASGGFANSGGFGRGGGRSGMQTPPPTSGFGTPGFSGGSAPDPFASSNANSNNNNNNAASSMTFGNSTSTGFGGGGTAGFGGSNTSNNNTANSGFSSGFGGGGGFDNSNQTNSSGFASSSLNSGGFGNSGGANNNGSNTAGTSFGSSPFIGGGQVNSGGSGFGNSTDNTAQSGFGASATSQNRQGFGKSGGGGSGWGSSSNTGNPFGGSQPAVPANAQDSSMVQGAPASGNPFGNDGGGAPPPTSFGRSKTTFGGAGGGNDDASEKEARLKAKMEEKKKLQAKIEEKKRRLMEKQRQKRTQSPPREAASESAEDVAPPPSLNPQASIFVPSAKTPAPKSSAFRASDKSDKKQSLAARNALRFGDQGNDRSKTRNLLPADMQTQAASGRPPAPAPISADPVRASEREDLHSAVALQGTCEFFCPDEELLRRERESDIQQLEMPLPGKLHPQHWTLRNTAVKRFRRSAADYKLDVPEWVRPPDVLERVTAYLEEWVMERDRQGPDPRFPQGQTPPSLEVYQFIWDRTRMIRKDFTLQNYVGTGGNCDARAVRCHERIARWHAMCEHHLSHIEDFATMQSQQNIQELGQTMKTLNQFYDDSLNRSVVEVPDEQGRETRQVLTGFSHGCTVDNVQGIAPVDFDGSPLNNVAEGPHVTNRIVGSHAVQNPSHGTAEPEMRGLYILLTVNNEGGMEVLKYAAKLFQERPEIYHSKPVQLALEIFKAKKEYNYARFFSLLRAPSTPYLFCCIMFKHVELMRKIAFRIMSKTFGARKKDTGEGIYDAYPLTRLTELLCFQDVDEARAACQHYNITVKTMKLSSSRDETAEVIFWRGSDFKEPKHPVKGFVLPLQPKKISRIIERKLNGATRLAVCRGEVSGEGATLHEVPRRPVALAAPAPALENLNRSESLIAASEKENAAALLRQQQQEVARLAEESKRDEESKKRREEEEKRREQERLRREAAEKEAEMKRVQMEKLKEMKRIQEEEMRKLKEKEEADRLTAIKRAEEEERRKNLEAERKRKEAEARRKAEEERRLAEEARKRAEAERIERERQERILAEKRRIEEEKRREILRIQLEKKRKREEEERRKEKEWRERIEKAQNIVLWKRLKKNLLGSVKRKQQSIACLAQVDPTFSSDTLQLQSMLQDAYAVDERSEVAMQFELKMNARWALERSLRENRVKESLSALVAEETVTPDTTVTTDVPDVSLTNGVKMTLLAKVGVFIPKTVGDESSERMCELLEEWLQSRVDIGTEDTAHTINMKGQWCEVRTIMQIQKAESTGEDCDVALVVVPPPWSTNQERRRMLQEVASRLDESIPRASLVIGDGFDHESHEYMTRMLGETLGGDSPMPTICNRGISAESMENALRLVLEKIAKLFVDDACVKIDRLSIPEMVARAVSSHLWKPAVEEMKDTNEVLNVARKAISAVVDELVLQKQKHSTTWVVWPPQDFISKKARGVPNYFGSSASLPYDWHQSLGRKYLEAEVVPISQRLNGSFRDVVESLLFNAPKSVREECGNFIARGLYRRCLQQALDWFSKHDSLYDPETKYIYFPRGMLEYVFERMGSQLSQEMVPRLIADDVDENASPVLKLGVESPNQPSSATQKQLLSSNKRRRSLGVDDAEGESQPLPVESPFLSSPGGRKRRPIGQGTSGSHSGRQSHYAEESAAFSKRLEELMKGGTVECAVGDSSLSRILRGVSKQK